MSCQGERCLRGVSACEFILSLCASEMRRSSPRAARELPARWRHIATKGLESASARNDRSIREMKPGWFSARPQLGPGRRRQDPVSDDASVPLAVFPGWSHLRSAYVPLGVSRNGADLSVPERFCSPELARSSTVVANQFLLMEFPIPQGVCMARPWPVGVAVLSWYTLDAIHALGRLVAPRMPPLVPQPRSI